MADEGSEDTFTYKVGGRDIVFRKTTMSQLMMMQRIVRRTEAQMHAAAKDPQTIQELMSQLNDMAFEAIESRFVDRTDLEFVHLGVLRGTISQEDLMPILSNGKTGTAAPDDADPVPAKRARKAPAKKATTKPASRRAAR